VSGIVALLRRDGAPVDATLLDRLTAFQSFRGPDGLATWIGPGVGLGHAHFLAGEGVAAPQPAALDDQVRISAYARIDAQRGLREELEAAGRHVPADCDDAVLILHAYLAWGERCLERLLGDFCFALWDAKKRHIFCAVDHFGVRPLYYAMLGPEFLCANTLDCLRLHPGLPDGLDDAAIGDFLAFGRYLDGHQTVYRSIRRLPAAHYLVAGATSLSVQRFWNCEFDGEPVDGSVSEIVDGFRHRLLGATGDRLRSRKAAIYMSGGLDSTLVAACAVRALQAHDRPWRFSPYTIVFRDLIPDDEAKYARLVATELGLDLKLLPYEDFAPFDWVERCSWTPPEPINCPDLSVYNRHLAEVAEHDRLVLTGWEGDEPLKVSLPWHWLQLARSGAWRRLGTELATFLRWERSVPPLGLRTALRRLRLRYTAGPPAWLAPEFARRIDLHDRARQWLRDLADGSARHPRHLNLQRVNWAAVFDQQDAGWSGVALESAHPFMDLRVMEYLQRLPPVPWTMRKHLLRSSGEGLLPRSVIDRRKTPLQGDPVRAAEARHGIDPVLVRRALDAVAPYVAFPASWKSQSHWIDPQWINARPLSLGCWLIAPRNFRRR
jgi:asparagine synthase (glutamine-hydrolysing)